ncbi:unnamed protein product [Pylaiella littoralis]
MMNYNKFQGSSKGWRFSPNVLRWALYALAKMGWQRYFITDQSWFDMRATIIGFVSMARYIFADKDLVEEVDGKATRFLYPRMFSQDILEMRFAHIRAGMGCHKAPTASPAAQAGMHGDTCRLSHGERRRNSSRSGGQPFDIQQGATQRVALPVNAEERGEVVRAATWRNAEHVFETRSV